MKKKKKKTLRNELGYIWYIEIMNLDMIICSGASENIGFRNSKGKEKTKHNNVPCRCLLSREY